jgi:adenine-specific DNA-methyltransferase
MDKLDLQSPDIVNQNLEKLAALFPNCLTETAEGKAIDFDLLKQELSHQVVEGTKERYRLEWPGKREAIVTANLPTTKTLRPVREDSVDFDNTENLYIEGDNLEVLKLLQESYLGKIKMISIDPPYNTGNDFVYRDNFGKDSQTELEESGQKDEYNQRLVANPETSGRYHSDWLSMMYPRLKLARNLLTDDGVIFISIDDNEVDNLKKICSEVFGNNNFVSQLVWKKKYIGGKHAKHFVDLHEYVLVWSKNIYELDEFLMERPGNELDKFIFEDEYLSIRGKFYIRPLKSNLGLRETLIYPISMPDGSVLETQWMVSKPTLVALEKDGRILYKKKQSGEYNIYRKYYELDGEGKVKVPTLIEDVANADAKIEIKKLFNITEGREIIFDNPKPTKLLKYFIKPSTKRNDIILDFFSGSATISDAIFQSNVEDSDYRHFILIQLPEATDEKSEAFKAGYKNICEIGKERIRRAAKNIKGELETKIENKKAELQKLETGQQSIDLAEKKETLQQEIQELEAKLQNTDFGFRVYRLDESNMQDVYYRPQDFTKDLLELTVDNIKPGRTPDDLLAQIMLDWGLPLSLKISSKDILGKQVFSVADDSLYACFDNGIDEAFIKEIAKDKPLRIVFKDSGFTDDTAKVNVKQLLKQLSPETEMKVI